MNLVGQQMQMFGDDAGGATFSPDGRYRYVLWRRLSDNKHAARGRSQVCFVMLNPSTADAHEDDPTLRRCIGFAKRWQYGKLVVVNLFGYVTSDPKELLALDPEQASGDPRNLRMVITAACASHRVIAGWGASAPTDRAEEVVRALSDHGVTLGCLGLTKSGAPRHPLYLRKDAEVQSFSDPSAVVMATVTVGSAAREEKT